MTYKQFLTQLICSSSNASTIAEALAGKFKAMYDKSTAMNLYITGASDEVPEDKLYIEIGDRVIALDPTMVRFALPIAIDEDYTTISIQDLFTGNQVSVDVDAINDSLTGNAFTNLLSWVAYDSIGSDDPAQTFLNKATLGNMNTTEFSQAVYSVYEILGNTKDKLSLLTGLNDFNGMSIITGEGSYEEAMTNSVKISDYTGVKPWIAWCSSLNISFDGLVTFPIQFQKMIDKLVVSILASVGKLVVKLFNPIINWIAQGSNPTDYVCKDPKFGYFNIPSHGITFDESWRGQTLEDFKGAVPWTKDETVVLQLYNNYFYYYPGETTKLTDSGRTVTIRKYVRYMKPVSPRAIMAIYNQGNYDFRKPGEALLFLKQLQLCDLELPNPDMAVEQDLLWATKISAMLTQSLMVFLNLWGETSIWYSDNEFDPEAVILADDNSNFGEKWNMFREFLMAIVENCQAWSQGDGSSINFTRPFTSNKDYFYQVAFDAQTRNGTVTNYDFADYLSQVIVTQHPDEPSIPRYFGLGLDDPQLDNYLFEGYISPVPLNTFESYSINDVMIHLRNYICDPFLAIQNFALGLYSSSYDATVNRQMFIPFKSNCPVQVSPNITIKTDSDNLSEFRNHLYTIVGIGATIAAIAVAGKLVIKSKSFMNNQALAIMTTRAQLNQAIINGDSATIASLRKTLVKQTKKYNTFSRILGASPVLGTTFSPVTSAVVRNDTNDTMLEEIMHLIK